MKTLCFQGILFAFTYSGECGGFAKLANRNGAIRLFFNERLDYNESYLDIDARRLYQLEATMPSTHGIPGPSANILKRFEIVFGGSLTIMPGGGAVVTATIPDKA